MDYPAKPAPHHDHFDFPQPCVYYAPIRGITSFEKKEPLMSESLYVRLSRRFAPERFKISRRDMLKASMAASAGLLLSDCNTTGDKYGPGTPRLNRKVVVIGAGFAGLACAHELRSVGYDVMVLEARPRVGGRVVSFQMVPGKVVEGGAELVGNNHPHWMAYARQFGLTFNEIPEETTEQLIFEGKVLTKEEAEKLHEEMDAAVEKLNDPARGINDEEPWATPGAKAMDAMSMADWLASLQISPLTKRAIRAWFEADEAVALEKQSYLAFLTMIKGGGVDKYWTDSETARCAQGNQALATKLSQGLNVRLNTEVKGIAYGGSGVVLTLRDGERIEADDVVMTVPPSLWKNIRFTPSLPEGLTPQMGIGVKYLTAVKSRFWRNTGHGTDSLSDTDLAMSWEATEGQEEKAGGSGIPTPAVVTGFSGGPPANHFRSRNRAELATFVNGHLEKIMPGFAENSTDNRRFMDWPADPWTQAGYSFAAPGEITRIGKILHDGLGRLHFAGEHTSYRFVGYMEGALDSGASLARRIAKRDGVRIRPAPTVETVGEGKPGKEQAVENPGGKVPAATEPQRETPATTLPAATVPG
jgi:monoamine oxidase